ncbi:MAG: hypothetical protein LBP53_00745 [Candidatus Peribacteria bacterium]|jgi:hypothetical protein|nr:hypothetical protein [Candidatus Peribacteria bacterium]
MKQGSGKSTTLDDITDLSGLRATFYGDITTQTQAIENTIITTMKAYRA